MVMHYVWSGHGNRNNEGDGIPQWLQWIQFQIQYVLILVLVYRIRTLSMNALIEYGTQLWTETVHYAGYIVVAILLFLANAAVDTAVTEGHKVTLVFFGYKCLIGIFVYGFAFAALELAMIYLDLTACGYSRSALIEHIEDFKLDNVFASFFPSQVRTEEEI
ncbi:hypothetical protein BGX28_006870 [Mortierella sp. GBA30]|nr:hypothetical protein BGX28_006870 [Mortierella sp. GBA30]